MLDILPIPERNTISRTWFKVPGQLVSTGELIQTDCVNMAIASESTLENEVEQKDEQQHKLQTLKGKLHLSCSLL